MMLIVLTGAVATYKRTLANAIKLSLNNITIDGYTVDFLSTPWNVYDSEGTLVYGAETNAMWLNEDGSANEAGLAAFENAKIYERDVLSDASWLNHFEDTFVDLAHDLGVTSNKISVVDSNVEDRLIPSSYQDIIDNYTNRLTDTHVITGVFANWVLEDLKTDIGADNIKVINIQRNPSSAYWAFFKDNPSVVPADDRGVTTDIDFSVSDTLEGYYEHWINAQIMSFKTAELAWVDTIRFEDIMQNGLTISSTEITLPAGMASHNGNITVYENVIVDDNGNEITASDITALNTKISTFDFATNFPTDLSEAENTFLDGVDMNTFFPANLFTALGYTALTYDQIIAS